MKFVVAAAAVLLAGTQSVAAKPFTGSLGGLNTFLDFRVEVDAANACDATAHIVIQSLSDGSTTRGSASVYPSLLKKIEKEFGHGTIHPTALEEVHQVQTKRFTETSPLHRDYYFNEQGVLQSIVGEDGNVGFIFGNTNEDAHFETDADGGLCFSVVEGTFMSFDGSIPHQTIVKSGHVEVIGPFLLSSKALIGAIGGSKTARPTTSPTKASKSPTAKSSKGGVDATINANKLASNQQANKSFLSFLIAGTMIVAAAALLNVVWKWAAQKWRQPRSINDLEEEEEEAVDVDGFEDDFEDEPKHYSSDVIVGEGEGNVEIVETH